MQQETNIRQSITNLLRLDGWFVFYIMQGLGAYKGIADLCAVKSGRTVWLEIKTPAGKQSKYQRRFQHELQAQGGEYRLECSVDDVRDMLDKYRYWRNKSIQALGARCMSFA